MAPDLEIRPGTGNREGTAPSPRSARWGTRLGRAGAFVLGAVLLVAAWSKAIDPRALAEQIAAEGLAGLVPAWSMALLAIALEAGLGLALLLGLRRNGVLIPTALLIGLFLALTGRAWWKWSQGLLDETAACGCFGNLVDRSPAEAFWQDLVLLVPPLGLAFLGRRMPARRMDWRVPAAVAMALFAAAFAWKAPVLPLDDVATRLRPGRAVAEICAGRGAERICLDALMPDLEGGRHLVVIADLASADFQQRLSRLNEYARAGGTHGRLWVVTAATPEELWAFRWQWGPAFEIREAPPNLLRPLYRTLPRSFLVDDGKVSDTWSGLPPALGETGEADAVAQRTR